MSISSNRSWQMAGEVDDDNHPDNIPKRSQTNDYRHLGGMQQKDHILRMARGALRSRLPLDEFVIFLELYVDGDDTSLDNQPLYSLWALGGAAAQPNNGLQATPTAASFNEG